MVLQRSDMKSREAKEEKKKIYIHNADINLSSGMLLLPCKAVCMCFKTTQTAIASENGFLTTAFNCETEDSF